MQRKVLKEEVMVMMEEAEKDAIEGLSRNVRIHKLNVNEVSTKEIYVIGEKSNTF